ncbi:MAG: hypothetical protein JST21_16665 [Bacteroidetes bacterium]|nr:hypothetical protein [Bacteroidota bacterium]
MKKIVAIILFIFVTSNVFAQDNTIDSLKLVLSKEKTDTGKIKLLNNIGGRFGMGRTKNDSALWYARQALNLSQKIKDIKGELNARFNMSHYFRQTGNYPEALKLSLYNLTMAREFHEMEILFLQTRETGWIYKGMGDYRKELEYEKKLFPLADSFNWDFPGYSMEIANQCVSIAYSDMNMPDSALSYSRVVYQFGVENNDPVWLMLGTWEMGRIHAAKENPDSAFFYYKISLHNAIKRNRRDLISMTANNISSLFFKQGKIDSAFFYVRKSQKELQLTNDPGDLANTDSLLAALFQSNHQYDSAYSYLKNYLVLNDSLNNQNKIAQAQNLSFNETMHQQQLEQTRKEAKQQYDNELKIYILAAIIIIFLIIAFLLFRNNRNKRKANILLSKQKEEIQNTLSELKSTQAQLIQSEKMASLGELTAGIAHEIQNPLNFVNNFSDINKELINELKITNYELKIENHEINELLDDLEQNSEKINHHGQRAAAIVKGMLQHSRASSGKKELTDINALFDEYLRLSYHGMRAKDKNFICEMKTDFDHSIPKINIIPQDIGRVILNLINNAFYAVNEKKKQSANSYQPTAKIITRRISDTVEIRVIDNGNGIPSTIRDKIFQPFFTTKPTGQGTGLGLSLSYDIVKAHGGELKIETNESEGSEFIILLPVI